MSKTFAKYNWFNTGFPLVYDKATQESLIPMFPVVFYDDFIGVAGGSVFDGTEIWNVVNVGDATNAIVADSSNGLFLLHLHVTSENEDAVLYMGDNRNFDVSKGLIFETRLNIATLPTLTAEIVWGMCGNHNLDNDTATESAWFKLDGSGALVCETDDTSNDEDDEATGITIVAGTYYIFRIDFTDLTDVKFYVDGVRVAPTKTFDMSNLTAGEEQMQPYFSLDKTGDAGLGDMNIDYVRIFSDRV